MPKNTIFNLQSLDRSARKRGDEIWTYKGHKCSCAGNLDEDQLLQMQDAGFTQQDVHRARLDCELCHGDGWWYEGRVKAISLAYDVRTGDNKDLFQAGIAQAGDMVLTPPHLTWAKRGLYLNDMDKVIFPVRGGMPCEGDVLTRGQFKNFPNVNRTSFPIARLSSITWHDPEEVNPTVHTCVAGVDFNYTVGEKLITWLAGPDVPPPGQGFTVSYHCWFEWVVQMSPAVRQEAGNLLGSRVLLKKQHLFMGEAE